MTTEVTNTRQQALDLIEELQSRAAECHPANVYISLHKIETILAALKASVPDNIVAGCPDCGDSVEVSDLEISEDGTETVIYVSNCHRCQNSACDDAYWRGRLSVGGRQ